MREILVESMKEEIRMAVLEDSYLQDIMIERTDEVHLLNHIYKGIVRNVLPGMDAAFLDIGIGRNVYLRMNPKALGRRLYVGESLLVQVVKEEMEGKAARVTTDVSVAGQYVVLLPVSKGIKISKKIRSDEKRKELERLVMPFIKEGWGCIVRTSAERASLEDIKKDVDYLIHTYELVQRRYQRAKGATELYRDADFYLRLVRDYTCHEVFKIHVNTLEAKTRLEELLEQAPHKPEILLDTSSHLFSRFGVEEEMALLLQGHVPLPSGGELRIDRTEALTVMDVNSKSFVGRNSNHEDTILAVNMEAAKEACRQMRLRDIGGMILIDFIDMEQEHQKEALLQVLQEELRKDRVRTVLCGLTSLGLVEITRKRATQGMMDMLMDTCSYCGGTGYLLSGKSVYLQIVRKLRDLAASNQLRHDVLLEVHPEVASYFTKKVCEALSRDIHKNICVTTKDSGNREAYAILAL